MLRSFIGFQALLIRVRILLALTICSVLSIPYGAWAAIQVEARPYDKFVSDLLNEMPMKVESALAGRIDVVVQPVLKLNSDYRSQKESPHDLHRYASIKKVQDRWQLAILGHWQKLSQCQGKDCSLFLKRLITHQIAHIFDEDAILFPESENDKRLFRYCHYDWPKTKARAAKTPPIPCQILSAMRKSVSDHVDFSLQTALSSDPQEMFAENFEKFLLEDDFECRYPTLYNYLTFKLGPIRKTRVNSCRPNYKIPLAEIGRDGSIALIDLDPSRVYRIDYFLATGGADIVSRWGHSMFRLVICSPKRSTPSEKCLGDTGSHIVVGFAATGPELLDPVKALTSDLRTVLSVMPISGFINQYNVGEDRALVAYPLRLSREEIKNIVSQMIHSYWNHDKNYEFLKNNCATEALHLIKKSLQRSYSPLLLTDPVVTTPNSLLEVLQKAKVIDTKKVDPVKERYVSYFPSMKEIALADTNPESEQLWSLSSDELRAVFDETQDKAARYQLAAQFQAIERARITQLQAKAFEWLVRESLKSSDRELAEVGLVFKEGYLTMSRPLDKTDAHQGKKGSARMLSMPLEEEVREQLKEGDKTHQTYQDLNARFKKLNRAMIKQKILGDFPQAAELQASATNLNFYSRLVLDRLFPKTSRSGR